MATLTLTRSLVDRALAPLAPSFREITRRYPGEPVGRQPVHTVYGGAHLFRADTAQKLGSVAIRTLEDVAPDAAAFGEVFALPVDAAKVHERVLAKLQREPVEDLRIDFEDGYGRRPDADEDAHALEAAREVAKGLAHGTLPPSLGIRIKPLDMEQRGRAVRTLDLFLTALTKESGGKLPDPFVVTLPKITCKEQVGALADLLDELESDLGFDRGAVGIELMIETTQSLFGPKGDLALLGLLDAGRGRCRAAHFGAYDYTANCNVIAGHQTLSHPACDFARDLMQVAFARTGIWIADGATNVLPIGRHRTAKSIPPLSEAQIRENRDVVRSALKLHHDNVRRGLIRGFYQGWDLHPAQLPARYAAVYAFFLEGLDEAVARLRNFVAEAAQATRVGEVFDDAATGQGLLNVFLLAVSSGAVSEEEATAMTGLSASELQSRSFATILENRKPKKDE